MSRDCLKPKFKFHKKLFELMIHEVFLPKQLPDFYDATKAYYHETRMLALTADVIQELSNELPKSTHNLFQTWSYLQCRPCLEAPELQNAIASLVCGEMLALYIRQQNCGFCLYIPHDKEYKGKAIVSTFPVSLENSLIMSNENDLQVRILFFVGFRMSNCRERRVCDKTKTHDIRSDDLKILSLIF